MRLGMETGIQHQQDGGYVISGHVNGLIGSSYSHYFNDLS